MTTPTIISVQVSASNTYSMVAEQGSLGLMFRHVPTIDDQVVSTSNPMPVTDANVVAVGTTADDVYTGTGLGSLVALLKGIYAQVVGTGSSLVSLGSTLSGLLKFQLVDSLGTNLASVDSSGNLNVKNVPNPVKASGCYSGISVNNASQVIVPADTATVFIDIINNSPDTIYLQFGEDAVAVENTIGQIVLAPGESKTWDTNFIPTDAIHAISSNSAGSAVTIGVK